MKKLLGTALVLLATLFIGYSQQDNNTYDDVYYQDNQQIDNPDQNYNNYDNNNADNGPTYQTFYDQLSPYGSWISYPGYGFCWVPYQTDPYFSPYVTNGQWVYTDMGWTWVSDYPWGWATFHYGRWFEDPYYGWVWVPGYDWAPAWVIWGDYNGYYGWACLGPRDILSPQYRPVPSHWHFIEHRYMGHSDFEHHIERNDVVAHNISEINTHVNIINHANTYRQSVFFGGPKPEEVERYSGQKVQAVHINNVKAPERTRVNGNEINIYRPNIVRSHDQHGTPPKVVQHDDFKPVNRPQQQEQPQRNNNDQRQYNEPQNNRQPIQNWTPPRQNTEPQRQNNRVNPIEQRNYVPSARPTQQPVQQPRAIPQQQPQRFAPQPIQQPHAAPIRGGGRR